METSQRAVQDRFEKDKYDILNLMDNKDLLSDNLNYSFQSMQGVTELAAVKKVPNIITGNIFKVCTAIHAQNYLNCFRYI